MSGVHVERPRVGDLVRVDVGEPGVEVVVGVASRVDDVDGDDVVVAAPRYPGDTEPPAPGDTVTLRWTGSRGVHVLATVLAGTVRGSAGNVVPRWVLRPTGGIQVVQRRRYSRAVVPGTVAVVPQAEGLTSVVSGTLVDISEGGVRLRLAAVSALDEGSSVDLHIELEGVPAVLRGTLLRVGEPGRGECEVVVVFDEPVLHADRIRRTVFRHQVLARRLEAR